MKYKVEIENLCKGAWQVRLWIGHQSFIIGDDPWETRAEARWFAAQFRRAIQELTGVRFYTLQCCLGRGPKVKVKRKK